MNHVIAEAPPVRPERTRRLFFALWPEPGLRESLARSVSALVPDGVGRIQRPDQLHLTLEFLGAVPESRLASVQRAAQATRGHACDVWLDRVAYWRRSSVLCLLASRTPPELEGLVAELRANLERAGFEPERRPYLAHLTLARKVWRPVSLPAPTPVCWPARTFVLVESRTDPAGSVYSVLESWSLAG
jgi:2'-5' RNA ligase